MQLADLRLETPEDAEKLLELARDNNAAGRETLYRSLWNLYLNRANSLSERERGLMLDILRRIGHDVEMALRVKLAERLAEWPDAPHDLAVVLANENIEIARPVLLRCQALQDQDLVEVITHKALQHQLAIALRQNIGEVVSQALVDTDNEHVVATLLDNHSARLSLQLTEHLAEKSKKIERWQGPLLRRPDVPREIAERMYNRVSVALRRFIVVRYGVDAEKLDQALAGAVRDAIGEDEGARQREPLVKLIDKLHGAGELSAAFLVRSLRQGQVQLFDLAFAKLSGLEPARMRRFIYQPGGEALAVACRAIAMDRSIFLAIYQMTRHARGDLGLGGVEATKLKRYFDNLPKDQAKRLVADPNYPPPQPSPLKT